MKIIKGDLVQLAKDGHFDVIVHGCNCYHTMGSGIARTIREEFPEAYEADLKTVYGSRDKLGTYSFAVVQSLGNKFRIMNAYTQHSFGGGSDLFEYDKFQEFLDRVKGIDYCLKERWGFPLIGCGLAGGDKKRILGMIEETLKDSDVTIVEFAPQ